MNRNNKIIPKLSPTFLLLLALLLYSTAKATATSNIEHRTSNIYRIHIQDYIIHPITAEYIEKALDRAEKEGAQALLIVLDTPGGLLQTTHNIVKEIMNSEIPIIVYVAPAGARAASAGVFITLAAHVAAMAPTTHIGAAHPVQMGEGDEQETFKKIKEKLKTKGPKEENQSKTTKTPMTEKILQDTLAWVEGIAKARNRNVNWAKRAVQESISSTAEEAKKLGVVDLIAANEMELLEKLDGKEIELASKKVKLETKNVTVTSIPLNWRQSILNVLINPSIAYILMILGFYGLLFEITHPGSWGPGVTGLICILLAFYSFHVIPPDYAGIILTAVGLLLFAAEVFVTSHGLLALGGLICLFLGGLFLIDAPAQFLKVSLQVIVPTILASAALLAMILSLTIKAHRRKAVTGAEGLVGDIGEADTDLNPYGKVFIQGELWDAQSEEPISRGEKVQILKVENLKLYVRRAENR